MAFHLRRFCVVGGCAWLLSAGAAVAQTTPTTTPPPPDKPVLDALPPTDQPSTSPRPAPEPRNEYGEPVAPRTEPTTPATQPQPSQPVDDGFRPARPAQPTQVPASSNRPIPANVGTPVAPPVAVPEPAAPKWFVGGNPTLGFSSVYGYTYFNAGVAALLGYRVTDRLALGPGLTYQYASFGGVHTSNYGGRVFGQFLISDAIFVHAEHEILSAGVIVEKYNATTGRYEYSNARQTFRSTFAGLGYRQHLGERSMFDFMVLYNFDNSVNYQVYGQPEIRINFLFDLNWR